jgi:hypothetical protein
MNINEWTPQMHEQRIADLRVQFVNVRNSRHLAPAIKAEKLKSIARKGKSHATRLKGFNATVRQNVMEYSPNWEDKSGAEYRAKALRYNGSIAWGSQIG